MSQTLVPFINSRFPLKGSCCYTPTHNETLISIKIQNIVSHLSIIQKKKNTQ
ncbi:hypothetical protein Hdeb2414_s0249g00847571 [Helianthus debilis subsp. tardiflorus]